MRLISPENKERVLKFVMRSEFRITMAYLIFGVLWILISDRLLFLLVKSDALQEHIAIYKGWFFVIGSASLFYFLLGVESRHREKIEDSLRELNQNLESKVKARTALLQESNDGLESFSHSVSHDLRAPLRRIDAFSALLQDEYGAKLDAEARKYIGTIRENTRKMSRLIEDLLEFSRVTGREPLVDCVDMRALAEEAWEEIARGESLASFDLGNLPPAAGDKAMLKQVWINLLTNAVKFSSKTPSPRILVTARTNNGVNEYCVKDNGAGFDPAQAYRLFGMFQRLHTEQEFEGTGVGLALVNRIIQRHSGTIRAESGPGAGAAFYFTLPTNRTEQPSI